MKILPRPPTALVIVFAIGLFAVSQWMLYHAIDYFVSNKIFAGIKFAGVAIIILGSCLDPINSAWLAMPFGWKRIVAPTRFSRLFWPFYALGSSLAIAGWMANHWFHAP